MSYLGKQPATQGKDAGPAVKIDDIASNFNGSVTVFDLAVESTAVNPHPNNLAVYLNGVLQHPGDSYAVSGSQIKFNEAPDSGLSFHGHILGSVRTNTPDEQTVTPSTLHDTTKTLISGSFNKGAVSASFAQSKAVSGSFAQKGAVSASFAQSSAVTASLRSHVLTSALSGSTTLISGSATSTGSFGSTHVMGNLNIGTVTANPTASVASGSSDANLTISGSIFPEGDNNHDLGSANYRWRYIYTTDLKLSNEGTGGNSVDGTEGNWTVEEGEEDLFVTNVKSGKKFRIKLEEIE